MKYLKTNVNPINRITKTPPKTKTVSEVVDPLAGLVWVSDKFGGGVLVNVTAVCNEISEVEVDVGVGI